jgi:hypothetical protein
MDLSRPNAALAAASVQDGSMPPAWAGLVDSRLRLSDVDRAQLVSGLQATFNTVPSAPASVTASPGAPSLAVPVAFGILLMALGLALAATPHRARSTGELSAQNERLGA